MLTVQCSTTVLEELMVKKGRADPGYMADKLCVTKTSAVEDCRFYLKEDREILLASSHRKTVSRILVIIHHDAS